MNTDTGEIRQFTAEEIKAISDPWTPLNRDELRAIERLPQGDRPGALREHRESRAKRRKLAAAARRKNRR